MRRGLKVGSVVGVILVAAALIAMANASGSGTTSLRAKAANSSAHPVAQMSVASTSVKRTLLSFEGTVQPGEFDGAVGTCPTKYPTPVSGWFSAKSDKVVLGESLPIGKKKWEAGVVNFDTVPSDYIVGMVCVK
jgi:hypothetical protein